MKSISPAELQLHSYVLSSGTESLSKLIEQYSSSLMTYLTRCYKKHLTNKIHFASEAVYNALEWYSEHPKQFNAARGSLKRFLEIKADKNLQQIFERENCRIHISGTEHLLSQHLDNDADISIAKMIIRNEMDTMAIVSLLDLGSWRFSQLLPEANRQVMRVKTILNSFSNLSQQKKRSSALILHLDHAPDQIGNFRQTGL